MPAPAHDTDEATMSLGDHLEELRRRLLFAGGPAIPLAAVLFFFSDSVIKIMVMPLRRVLENQGLPPRILALAPPEVLIIKLKISLILAAVVLAPWILWQAWLFIRPGLYAHERRFVHFLVPGSVILTASGTALLYFVMLPLMLSVLVSVGSELDLGQGEVDQDPRVTTLLEQQDSIPLRVGLPDPPREGLYLVWPDLDMFAIVPTEDGALETLPVIGVPRSSVAQTYRLSTYIQFVLLLLVGIVVAFQMPLVIVLLGWLGLASPDWLAENRRWALFICGMLSALLTPADVVSMMLLLLPLYGLYELGILLLRLAPASAVAEGSIWTGFGKNSAEDDEGEPPDPAPPADPAPNPAPPPSDPVVPDRTDATPGQPTSPVRAEGSVPRSSGRTDQADQPSSEGGGDPRDPT